MPLSLPIVMVRLPLTDGPGCLRGQIAVRVTDCSVLYRKGSPWARRIRLSTGSGLSAT